MRFTNIKISKKIAKLELNPSGNMISKTVYEYDDNTGILIKKKIYNEKNNLKKEIII